MNSENNKPIKLPELLPCPFCGGKAELERQHGDIGSTWAVICVGDKKCPCYCHRPYAEVDKLTAVEKWNTRNEADALRAEVGRLTTRLAMATTFELVPYRGWITGETNDRPTVIEQRPQREGELKWVVKMQEWVLTKSGEWEWEPRPSERSDEFITSTRFDSVDEALEAYAALKDAGEVEAG